MADNKVGDDKPADSTVSKIEKWFPETVGETAKRLGALLDQLIKVNRTISILPLASLKNPESSILADSISASKLMAPKIKGAPLYDMCSGNGLPAFVFAILNPTIKVVMLEDDRRKQDVYKLVLASVSIDNISIQAQNIEHLPENSVKYLVARNFSPLQKALLLSRKAVMKGGMFFQMRGDGWANELASIPSQLFSYWTPNLLGVYRIPELPQEYAVLSMEKYAN